MGPTTRVSSVNGLLEFTRSVASAALRNVWPTWRDPYARTLAFLARSERWDSRRMAAWQLHQVNLLLRHAFQNCPGHARKLNAAGYGGDLTSLDELAGIPFLTKDELRTHGDTFTATNYPATALRAVTSGGTTGTPTRFMVEARTYDGVFDAWRHAMWRRGGFAPGSRSLDLTWAYTDGGALRQSSEPNRTHLSIHALNAKASHEWWGQVSNLRPEFIIGFPSTATALAKLLPVPGALPSVRVLLLASESLTADQCEVLAISFPGARVLQWYGMSELAGFASGCEFSDAFHHWPQSGVLEIIGENGVAVREAGQAGEIVLTGFLNAGTPFIRYRTGDRATIGDPCRWCGRAHAVLSAIDGRLGDYLLGSGGRMLPLSALNFHSDEFRHVFAHQFVQDEPARVVLRLVPLSTFTEADVAAISRLVGDRLGVDIHLTVELTETVTLTSRGKQPLILQRCPMPRASGSALQSGTQ